MGRSYFSICIGYWLPINPNRRGSNEQRPAPGTSPETSDHFRAQQVAFQNNQIHGANLLALKRKMRSQN